MDDRSEGAEMAPHTVNEKALAELPPPNTKRWVIRRKAQVVEAVRSGAITLDDACARYSLSVEEFLSWQRAITNHGVRGLRATRAQKYRSPRSDGPTG
jgi:hypothetical protein